MMVGSVHSNGWTPGEKVIARRVVDAVTPRGQAVERVKVGDDGIVHIEDLAPGRYHLTGDHEPVRQVRVTVAAVPEATAPAPAGPPAKLSPEEIAERLGKTRPPEPQGELVIGMRSTASRRQPARVDVGRKAA